MSPALSICNLRKVYRRGTLAVEDLSLVVPAGDFFGLLGPNGAGKSTTIHCVTGIATPSSGTICVFGVDVVREYRRARRLIGFCPQESSRVDTFANAAQIIDWMGGYFGMPSGERKRRTAFLLERFGLEQHARKPFYELSGGLRRRVVLARALIHDPQLLILDEPTAGMDIEVRHDLWSYLTELNYNGKTIVLISHYMEEVAHLCRTIAIVNRGRVLKQAPKEEFEGGNLAAAYLGAIGVAQAQVC